MSVETVAKNHQRTVNNITSAAVYEADKAWRMVDVDNLDASWRLVAPSAVALVGAAQVAAAAQSDTYLARMAGAHGVTDSPAGRVNADAFREFTGSGISLAAFLGGSIGAVKGLIGQGWSPAQALQSGRARFANSIITTVTDQARQSTATAMGTRASGLKQGWVGGYTRMVSPGACSRCIILAGRRYQSQEAFLRHPGCKCTHIPAAENKDDDPTTDPHAAFESMTREEQDERFGQANAEAIRQGADIFQVVNATNRGGVYTAGGERYTREGITRRGSYGRTGRGARMTPETIFKNAKTPAEAVELLRFYKYIL
ncbi:VG15 protein [Brevibacterium oceani]|uniref:VG15 protein n=1 Tax=Brevibacterium oceani TaxID=358099 RepID=UPI0015E76339|nr:hypothetical protein [Brevibacterium oceani]